MASDLPSRQQEILDGLNNKSQIKQRVYTQTLDMFGTLKEILNEMSNDMNDLLESTNDRREVSKDKIL